MSDGSHRKAARIRELNDQLRCKALGGRIVITRGIETLGSRAAANVLAAVAAFDCFTEDNNPWGEHDCAVLTVDGRRYLHNRLLRPRPRLPLPRRQRSGRYPRGADRHGGRGITEP